MKVNIWTTNIDAIEKQATLITGNKREGNLIYPTLLDNVTPDMRIAWEEPFGPVLPIIRVKSDEEAVAMVVKAIRDLETRLGVPQHMSEVGAKEEDFAVLAHKAYVDPCTGGNPREVTEEAIIDLFKASF